MAANHRPLFVVHLTIEGCLVYDISIENEETTMEAHLSRCGVPPLHYRPLAGRHPSTAARSSRPPDDLHCRRRGPGHGRHRPAHHALGGRRHGRQDGSTRSYTATRSASRRSGSCPAAAAAAAAGTSSLSRGRRSCACSHPSTGCPSRPTSSRTRACGSPWPARASSPWTPRRARGGWSSRC
jgi:hypothetical protein